MKFGKTSAIVLVTVLLASALLAVSSDTAMGASSKGYGSSDSMSVEYHVAETGEGVADITLTVAPGVSTVDVKIGGNDTVNPRVSGTSVRVGMESPLKSGSYPVLVTAAGKQIATCTLTVGTYYTVNVTAGAGGSASASQAETLSGSTVILTATPDQGYRLKEWSCSDVIVTNNSFTMPAKDITVNAVFEKIPTYSVTVTTDGNGTASASVSSAEEGTKVTLSAVPAQGYIFKAWESSDVTVTDNSFTMPAKDVTVKAVFESSLVPATGITISDSELTLKIGDEATLTATVFPTNANDRTVSWSSADSTVVSVVNGEITALKAGIVKITATSNDGGFKAECTVTVNPPDCTVPSTDGQVAKEDIDKAIESVEEYREEGLEQDVTISGNGDSVSVPADSVKTILDLGSKVTVKLSKGSVTVNSVTGLQAGDDLKVVVEPVEVPSGFVLPDDAVVVDVSMLLGEKKLVSFDSPITISIPYALSAGQDSSKLKVYHLSDDGKATDMNATYDAKSGAMVFTTDHLSVYAVTTSVETSGDGASDDSLSSVLILGAILAIIVVILACSIGRAYIKRE